MQKFLSLVNMYTRLEIYIKQQIEILKNYNNNNDNKKDWLEVKFTFPKALYFCVTTNLG